MASVTHDGEQPNLAVPAAETIEEPESAQIGLLDDVFGILFVPGQPTGKVISRAQVWKDDLFEECSLVQATWYTENSPMRE
jgi:hypothetical protein